MTTSAMIASIGMPNPGNSGMLALPIAENARSGLKTVVSPPISRATPRTAVSDPSVTINGGSFPNAISPPLISPNPSPVSSAAGSPSQPHPSMNDASSAAIADAAKIDPTEISIPPVRMTNVIPAASTVLIAACWSTMPMFCDVKKRWSLK